MSPLGAWLCTGSQFRNLRSGALIAKPSGYTPKGTFPSGLVTVNPGSLANYSAQGPDIYVHKVNWSALEPTQGSYAWSTIDNVLSTYGANRMILRILCGENSPGWLKTATGTIECFNVSRSVTTNPPHWWEPVAYNAYQALITAAGARYDGDPRVVLVSAAQPVVGLWAESFVLGNDTATGIRLHNAGLTKAGQLDAIRRCVAHTAAAFPSTHVEIAIHGTFQWPTASGISQDWTTARSLMNELALQYGAQLVVADYGLGVPDTGAAHPAAAALDTASSEYGWMRLRPTLSPAVGGGPIGYQLTPNGLTSPDNYNQMATNALDLGGDYVETSGWGSMTNANITARDSALKIAAGGRSWRQ